MEEKRLMKKIAAFILILGLILIAVLFFKNHIARDNNSQEKSEHIYASWDTMEYDKCVAIWLIKRYYDTQAQFVFYPKDTDITEGIVFDVPGAAWSRQHRKCTSDCILEELKTTDPVVIKIVKMAHDVELNFWQLDAFPESQISFEEVRGISDSFGNMELCVEAVVKYFDQLYLSLKKES